MKYINNFFLFFLSVLSLFASSLKEEQTLNISFLNGSPKHVHTYLTRDFESTTLTKALFEGLTRINLEGKVEFAIAEKIEISNCKTKYIIHLRESNWSNKEKLTASHFVNAWKSAIKPDTKCANPHFFFVIKNAEKIFKKELPLDEIGVYALSDNKIEIHLEHPVAYFTQLLADPFFSPIYNIEKMQASVFNGPFMLGHIKYGKEIQLKKNLSYWDTKNVKLDLIIISHVADALTAYDLYRKGKLDFVGSPYSDLPEEILQSTNEIKVAPALASYWMFVNVKNPKFGSKNIRKALSLAIDRRHIAKYILSNANPCSSILPKELSLLQEKSSGVIINQAQKLFKKGLKELGYASNQFSLKLSYTSTVRHASLAKYLKYQWEKVFNIKVQLDKSDWNTFFSKINSSNYEIGGFALYPTFADPLYFLERFCEEKMNRSNWENQDFKRFIDLANNAISERKLKKYMSEAEKILLDEIPIIPVYTHKHLYFCNDSLKKMQPTKLLYQDFKWAYFEK